MLAIRNTTSVKPQVNFEAIATAILGKNYELSLVLAGEHMMRRLSLEHKGSGKHTNVLSFPLSRSEGEIFIHAHEHDILHLFIHACLHLAGYTHGSKMDAQEQKLLKQFSKRARG